MLSGKLKVFAGNKMSVEGILYCRSAKIASAKYLTINVNGQFYSQTIYVASSISNKFLFSLRITLVLNCFYFDLSIVSIFKDCIKNMQKSYLCTTFFIAVTNIL